MHRFELHRSLKVACNVAIMLAALVVFTACQAGPRVVVSDQQFTERTPLAQRIQFTLELANPSDAAIELRELNYDVHIDGRSVYSGRRAAQVTLPAAGTIQIIVPAIVSIDDMDLSAATQYQISGNVTYLTPGAVARMLRDAGMPRPRVSFVDAGDLTRAMGD